MAKDKPKSIYRDTGFGIGEFIESGGGIATMNKVAKHLGSSIKGTKNRRRTNKSGAYTPNPNAAPAKQTGRAAVKPNVVSSVSTSIAPKAVPNALEVSISSAPSKAKGTATTPPVASFKKTRSTIPAIRQVSTKPSPTVTGQISPKNHIKMEPKVTSSSKPMPKRSTQITNTTMSNEAPKTSGGLLRNIAAFLTKTPTARGPSEYEQIMNDIQPTRKKRK